MAAKRSKKKRKSKADIRNDRGFAGKLTKMFTLVKPKRTQDVITVSNYEITTQIGFGAFGFVMIARDIHTNVEVAAKLEPIDTSYPQLKNEYKIYEKLGNETPGFIKIFYYGPCNKLFNALIMELLGPDLDNLFEICNNIFSEKTVLMIAIQVVNLLRYVHSKHIVYRDIKPENFCIGTHVNKTEKTLYLIDFGLSKVHDGRKVSDDTVVQVDYLVGTARYMSLAAHDGIEQSPKDDLESLGYMFVYLLYGSLPWMGMSLDDNQDWLYNKIKAKKQASDPRDYCRDFEEFVLYLECLRRWKHRQEPNYDELINILKNAMHEKGYANDGEFDWTPYMKKQYMHEVIEVDPDD